MIKASIIGGSGYVGGELLRLLLFHPNVNVVGITSQSHCGESVSDVHQNLTNITHLQFQEENIEELVKESDVVFVALPHGVSQSKIKNINLSKTKVIDLGADFRLKDTAVFEKAYGMKHVLPTTLSQAVYGLPELYKKQISKAHIVACPGCFPTGAILALHPLAKNGLLSGHVVIDSKTGSSGSGIKPSETTHHPERAYDFKAYNIFTHRHFWEIKQELSQLSQKATFVFNAHSAPMVRGIFTSAYVFLEKKQKLDDIKKLYQEAYADSSFVRLVDSPRVAVVVGSNYCDIGIYMQGNTLIVTSAIDNLIKGAAGQAVQCMNLMFNFPEITGLTFPGLHP